MRDNYSQKNEILAAMSSIHAFPTIREVRDEIRARYVSMTDSELREMKKCGHLIAPHGFDHDILTEMNFETLRAELESINSSHIYNSRVFAIPFGTQRDYNARTTRILEDFGFDPILANEDIGRIGPVTGRVNLPDTSNKYVIHSILSGFSTFLRTGKIR